MRILRIHVLVLALLFFLQGPSFSETKEGFPKIGFVNNNDSNVRAGDNVNFETLLKLKKGDSVTIVGERYSWFKIKLPKTAYLYIKNDYVDVDPKGGAGKVNAVRVILRSGPATKYSIVGQVSKPQELVVASEKDGWCKIEPPEGTTGWIHASQISFKSIDAAKKSPALSQPNKSATEKLMLKSPKPKGNLIFSTQGK